jgi:molecular chaperone GrpE
VTLSANEPFARQARFALRMPGGQPMSAHRPDGEPEAPEGQNDRPEAEAARVAELEAEAADLKDRLLRALAEQENARRRAERDREEAIRFAASGLARDLLSTLDNLRRAIEAVPEEKAGDETVRQLLTGVVATERALLGALAKHGIRRIDSLGEPFNPDRHEAVFEVTDPARSAGTVAEVLQEGYLHHDRLLRPAMVGVAKGGEGPTESDSSNGHEEASPVDRRD